MAVLMQAQVPGMTEEMYEGLAGDPGFFAGLKAAPGYLGFHAGGSIEGGWQVLELWDSNADHEAWVEAAVAPNMPEELLNGMDVTYHPIHTAKTD